MPNIEHIATKNISGLDVCLYNFDLLKKINTTKLENHLIDKINRMRIHRKAESYANCIPPNILEKYGAQFNKNLKEINPANNRAPSKPHFSPKRSRVTEFLAQLLLEKKESCIFFEEADKRIIMSALDDDKHAPGIDITGIKKTPADFKFVVCELKANKEASIPCSSSQDVLTDIKKSYEDEKCRLSSELSDFLTSLDSIFNKDDEICSIMEFLFSLIAQREVKEILLKNIIFIPFLIRQNEDIVNSQNLDDFVNYNPEEFKGANIKGIILSFNTDITEFSKLIYGRALENDQ